jgi:hypothetical protein
MNLTSSPEGFWINTIMNINEQKMLDYYEKVMDQVYLLYHKHPTNLTHINLSDAERSELTYYDAMGRDLAQSLEAHTGKKNKRVHLHSDPNFSNGLPRKK